MTNLEVGLLVGGALLIGYHVAKKRQAALVAVPNEMTVARVVDPAPTVIINETVDPFYYPYPVSPWLGASWNFYGGGRRRGGGGHHGGHHRGRR